MDHISVHVKGELEKSSIQEMREQYAPRAYVDKEIMKIQNTQRKIMDEQKHLAQMKQQFEDRLELFKEMYTPFETFEKEIKQFATKTALSEVSKKVGLCAKTDKTVASMQRIEKLNETLKRTVGKDYATKDRVAELM